MKSQILNQNENWFFFVQVYSNSPFVATERDGNRYLKKKFYVSCIHWIRKRVAFKMILLAFFIKQNTHVYLPFWCVFSDDGSIPFYLFFSS